MSNPTLIQSTVQNLNTSNFALNNATIPAMIPIFPDSWITLLHEWQTNALGNFEKRGKKVCGRMTNNNNMQNNSVL
jgi:hypothetical protein